MPSGQPPRETTPSLEPNPHLFSLLQSMRAAGRVLVRESDLTRLCQEVCHPTHPFIAHAPTMRVPMKIQGTDHVYLAMWPFPVGRDVGVGMRGRMGRRRNLQMRFSRKRGSA